MSEDIELMSVGEILELRSRIISSDRTVLLLRHEAQRLYATVISLSQRVEDLEEEVNGLKGLLDHRDEQAVLRQW